MSTWVNHPLSLLGETVNLLPMERAHFAELEALAREQRIWQHYAYDLSDPVRLYQILEGALLEREQGTQYPFVIQDRSAQALIGSTRLMDMWPKHRKLEIGFTWLHPDYWGTAVNLECKLLLLTYCFETLQTVRVQLKTDEQNIRSRKAIEKIGGRFEGIFRNDMIRDNGTHRHSAYYSIIDTEWPEAKRQMSWKLQHFSR